MKEQGHRFSAVLEAGLLAIPEGIRKPIFKRGMLNILINTGLQYPAGFDRQITELWKDGCAIEIVANHTSHPDAFPAALVGNHVRTIVNSSGSTDGINGYMLPFALSLKTGGQGSLLDSVFGDTRQLLEDLGTTPVFTATPNDIEKGRVDGSNTVEYARTMIEGAKQGKGIIVFPEGRVESGRRDENGNIKGMQRFREGALQQTLRISATDKKRVAVIPVGIAGGYKVYDPETKSLTREAMLIGLGLSNQVLSEVNVGEPFVLDKQTIRNAASEDLDLMAALRIKALLPQAEQGTAY